MEFYDVIRTRRSVRSYRADPIPKAVLDRVLNAARIAPSGSNRQPTRLILVSEEADKQKLVSLCYDQAFIGTAPVVVVACARDINYSRGDWMGHGSLLTDGSIVVDHLTLAARAEGLGTCWIGWFKNAEMKEYLRIPDDMEVVAVTPLGYPEGDPFTDPQGRIPLEDFVRWGKWQ